jgi:hypothetical protein
MALLSPIVPLPRAVAPCPIVAFLSHVSSHASGGGTRLPTRRVGGHKANDPLAQRFSDVDIAVGIDRHAIRSIQLAEPELRDVSRILFEYDNSVVAKVRHEDVAVGVDINPRWRTELAAA